MKDCKTFALHAAGESGANMSTATGCATTVTVNGKTIDISTAGKFIYRGQVIGDDRTSAGDALRACEKVDERLNLMRWNPAALAS